MNSRMNNCTLIIRRACVLMLLALLSLTFGASADAQKRIPREVHLGVVGGANLSEYVFFPRVNQRYALGYTGGVAVRYIEETLFGLQAELHITRRGTADYYESLPDLHYERNLTYLELPVMAHVYFKMGERSEVAFDIGPKLGWYLSSQIDSNLPEDFGMTGSQYQEYANAHHNLPVTNRLDYGIQAGLGYEFKFNRKMSMQIQGRYYYGLGNIWPDTKADKFQQSSNQSIQAVLTFWWRHTIRGHKVKP